MKYDRPVSASVIRRLPRYYRFLGELLGRGVTRISSKELSRLMKQGGALSMGRTALRLSAELAPLLGQEQEALRSAHCMAGYYSWLSASPS